MIRDNLFTQNKVTDYAHGFQYLDHVIQHFPTAEGYVSRLNLRQENGVVALLPSTELPVDFFTYVYNYTDHLGNIRLSYAQDPDTQQLKIVEQNHYYPFGLRHTNYSGGKMQVVKEQEFKRMAPTPEELLSYKYKYNGKEFQDELGLNMYDYGARNYDAAIGRWMNMDAQSEKWNSYSPYVYVLNNPLIYIDPDGNDVVVAFTGGPSGGGKTVDPKSKEASTAGRVVQEAQKFAKENGIEFSGRVITPGVTSSSSVQNALGFIKDNYTQGEKVIIYGYSYGGDFAVELAEALKEEGISVDLLVTIDAADGTGQNLTVNNVIPDNVKNALNFFQDTPSGLPFGAQHGNESSQNAGKKAKKDSNDSNGLPASHGGKKKAANAKKTKVNNYRVKDKNVNHGNIDEKTEDLVNTLIQQIMKS